MSAPLDINFDEYLTSIVSKYERSQDHYTQTDAASWLDFCLMAQTVQEQKEPQEEQQKEKIERLPVLDGIGKYAAKHVLLVGRPGSGKTTTLRKLLLDEARKALGNRESPIPVSIELRSWRTSAIDLIKDFFRKHKLRLTPEKIDELLFDGRLLLLIDGVNELPSDPARQDLIAFREMNSDAPMVFTTRILGVGGNLGIVKKLEMLPLSEPQMRQFIQLRLPEQGNQMVQQLGDRLRKFGETPLLLSMLCEVFKKEGRVPANLGLAFRDFANLYDGKLKEDVSVYEQSRSWWSELLQQLAFAMMPQDRPEGLRLSISKSEAVDILDRFLDAKKFDKPRDYAKHWLDDLLKHHLIQVKFVGAEAEIEFRHQLIQEYYAAKYLYVLLRDKEPSDIEIQKSYLNYLDWTESLALMLELVEEGDRAVRLVRLALEVDLQLGARLAGAVKLEFKEKTVGLLIEEIDERKIPQLYAIELFEETKSSFVVKPLIHALKDADDYMRRRAAEVLGKIGSDKAVEPLIQALKDTDSDVRRIVAEALVRIGSDKAVEPLIQALKDTDSYMRRRVAEVLGEIGSDKAVEPLIQALKDTASDVRRMAAEALGKIGSDKAVEPLIQALKDTDSDVRRIVAEALVRIGSDKAVEPLIQALKDTDSYMRRRVAEVLGEIGSDKAVEPLIQALKDTASDVRRMAAEALGKIGSDKAVEPLIQALKDTASDVRWRAVEALVKIGSDKAVDPLIQALKDENSSLRRNAAEALGKIGSDKAVDPLIQALKDTDSVVQGRAAEALGKIGSDKAIDPLIQALQDADFCAPRRIAAEALGKIDSDKAIDPLESLIQALKNSDMRRKAEETSRKMGIKFVGSVIQAAEALGKIGSDKTVETLIQALKDTDSDVRWRAVEALVKIGSDKAVESLIQALEDQNFYVRKEAVEALGRIGSDIAVEPLIQALKDESSSLRRNAAEALGKIGSDKAVELLIQALKDENSVVRKRSVEALKKIAEVDRNLPTLTQQLPHLIILIPTDSSQQSLSVITAIQARCKYYNYDIAQTPLPEADTFDSDSSGNRVIKVEVTEGGKVGTLVVGDLTVKRDYIEEQSNYNPPLE